MLGVSILALTLTAAAQTASPRTTQAQTAPQAKTGDAPQKAIDDVDAQLADVMAKLSYNLGQAHGLDDSDAKLKKSDQAQADTTEMIKKGLDKNQSDEAPKLQMRANEWDRKRQEHINSGCPSDQDQSMPTGQAERCNEETRRLMAERAQLFADAQDLAARRKQFEDLRDSVSATTLANFQQEKANNAEREALNTEREALEAAKKKLEAQLEALKNGSDTCAKLLRQKGATCEKIKARCGVMFDNSDPDLPASIYDSPCGKIPAVKPKTGGATSNSAR
jgi:chromosome segregation ATPase